jgi:23S rRNA pseudouridine1911/1915/1917 synthase
MPRVDVRSVPGDGGYALHAAELTFRHPATGDMLTIVCEPPPELRTL